MFFTIIGILVHRYNKKEREHNESVEQAIKDLKDIERKTGKPILFDRSEVDAMYEKRDRDKKDKEIKDSLRRQEELLSQIHWDNVMKKYKDN